MVHMESYSLICFPLAELTDTTSVTECESALGWPFESIGEVGGGPNALGDASAGAAARNVSLDLSTAVRAVVRWFLRCAATRFALVLPLAAERGAAGATGSHRFARALPPLDIRTLPTPPRRVFAREHAAGWAHANGIAAGDGSTRRTPIGAAIYANTTVNAEFRWQCLLFDFARVTPRRSLGYRYLAVDTKCLMQMHSTNMIPC